MLKCRNCKELVKDDSKSFLNELGLFCSKNCYLEFKNKYTRNPVKYGFSTLF